MKIKEIELCSDDLKATERFYKKVLDVGQFWKGDNRLSFFAGSTKITFHRSDNSHPVYHLAFDIPHNQLDQALAWLSQRTDIIPVSDTETIADFANWAAKSFYFHDNNGNILEFICRFAVSNASDAPFGGSSILYVSEMGLVTDDVAGVCKQIKTKYGLSFFTRQQPTEKFSAMGDDYGLLIIVDSHRNWYPTQQPSRPFPLKLVFDGPKDANQVLRFP
ncbi:VOC family protein [Flavobacterium sp.]|uniref:VOC family protein n=1 Tax=Flavobacterium sp. TaxID=239 RepID=UPI0039E2C2CA